MDRKNLVLMGLRNLLLILIQEYQRNSGNEPVRTLLKRFVGHNWAMRELDSWGMVDVVNALASRAEEAGVADEMRLSIQQMLLHGSSDLEELLMTYLLTDPAHAKDLKLEMPRIGSR